MVSVSSSGLAATGLSLRLTSTVRAAPPSKFLVMLDSDMNVPHHGHVERVLIDPL